MKKIIFFIAVAMGMLTVASAQTDIKIGIHAGIPVGDIEDGANFKMGADFTYFWSVMDIIKAGPMVGYSHYFTEDLDGTEPDDLNFLPLGASGRVTLGGGVFLGADLGYAIGLNDGNDGGFFYRPKLGFGFLGIGIVGSYEGINVDGVNVASVNVGVEFGF
ncbi:hypothetical protein [Salinimicrobium flavum]|uniref:Outer membrane protein beta-barrel domain-containing protein n=1 Tax=Salinimicrobium flavum TaxID=1737065 RepID=A0ABW5J1I9_9FLAO